MSPQSAAMSMSLESIARPALRSVRSVSAGMLDDVMTCRVSPVLVGRTEQLAALDSALATAASGSPAAILIGGEAGIGKSRLLAEFEERADGRVLTGGCLELGQSGLPFAPFTAVLRQLVRELGVAGVAGLLAGPGSRELGRLLPELGQPAGLEDEAYQGEARVRLFEQVLALFERLAQDGPVTLIIEDAHWADPSTRDLLTFLIGNQQGLPGLLIVVTFRSDELHRTHPLRPLLAELGRISWVDRLELPRLSRAEAAGQIAAILATELGSALVETVFRRSEGNPLFVEHLIGCEAEVPESLRDLVLATVQRLPEETRELLRVASSAGSSRIGHQLLAQVSDLGEDDLARALRPAVAGNVLLTDAEGYQFRHSLIQEVMHEDLLPGEHSRVHARYAEAIYADPSLVPPGRAAISLAHHWYSAHDVTWALIGAWQAAGEAGRALAHSEQLSMLSRVLELWDGVPDAASRIGADHVRVLEEAARVCHFSGDTDRGVALATAALAELDAQADPARTAALLDARVTLNAILGVSTNEDLLTALQLVSDGQHERERAHVLASLAHQRHKQNAETEARDLAEQALELARGQGAAAVESRALMTLAMLSLDGWSDQVDVFELMSQARAAADQAGDFHMLLTATINESHLLEGLGQHLRAAEVARAGLGEAERYGMSRRNGALLTANVAEPLIAVGRWVDADSALTAALAAPSSVVHRHSLWRLTGDLALLRGDLEAAADALARSSEAMATLPYRDQNHLPLARLEIEVLTAQGRFEEALSAAQAAIGEYDLQASPRYAWPLLAAAGSAAADVSCLPPAARTEAVGQLAREVLHAVRTEAAKLDVIGPVQAAHQLTLTAELDRASPADGADGADGGDGADPAGRPRASEPAEAAAPARWLGSAAAWEALGQPYQQAAALYRAAEAALAGGDREPATAALRSAAELAAGLGASRLAGDIAVLGRRARIGLTGDGAVPQDTADRRAEQDRTRAEADRLGLTPREAEVLRLVAAGQGNAAIASELFISAKTVSVHVSNILAKLGVTSRGEAAAVAHRLRLFDDLPSPAPG
jgi:predicted ATPase/DNA-binding CsgD family transcriptional regulator